MSRVLNVFTPLILSMILFLNLAAYAPVKPLIGHGHDVVKPVPYQISLQIKSRPNEHICGGTIISAKHILTAAHCLDFVTAKTLKHYRVLAGTSNLKRGGSIHRITRFKIHPNYNKKGSNYDIAIAKVSPKFKLNEETIDKIDFENTETIPGKTPAVLTGWGLTECFNEPNILQVADFITLENAKCKKDFYPELTALEICAHGQEDSFANFGDSGGPLVNENKTMLIGLVSYGESGDDFPDVFTRVSMFVEWIKKEMLKI